MIKNEMMDEGVSAAWMELERNKMMGNVFLYIIAVCKEEIR